MIQPVNFAVSVELLHSFIYPLTAFFPKFKNGLVLFSKAKIIGVYHIGINNWHDTLCVWVTRPILFFPERAQMLQTPAQEIGDFSAIRKRVTSCIHQPEKLFQGLF